ncbi:hypothetical protein Srufu_021200 [Streptomyces libani subsp. rufus]|nr:hypothetical protein Srufu_021200 [Streptomyces libani subsp. rufus]
MRMAGSLRKAQAAGRLRERAGQTCEVSGLRHFEKFIYAEQTDPALLEPRAGSAGVHILAPQRRNPR